MIAALFVEAGGAYCGIKGVDPWDETRDARLYPGPWPVVAHPPCARWCKLAGLVEARWGHRRHEDGGCFASALDSVRRWGGVLEHPAYSDAWWTFALPRPPPSGGWVRGIDGGWVCHVEQGSYGHRAPKPTWLYAFGVSSLPSLRWGASGAEGRLNSWYPSPEVTGSTRRRATVEYLDSKGERSATPPRLPRRAPLNRSHRPCPLGGRMTRALALAAFFLASCGSSGPSPGVRTPAAGGLKFAAGESLVTQLDALQARIDAFPHVEEHARACERACLTGVESIGFRSTETLCRCRRVASLGVYRVGKGRP